MVANRTVERAEQLAGELGCEAAGLAEMVEGDIWVHTTAAWTLGSAELPVFCSEEYVCGFEVVMDIAYKPLMTPLLEMADKAGIKVVTGEKMLLYQAVEQFKLWTDEEAPVEVMREVLNRNI